MFTLIRHPVDRAVSFYYYQMQSVENKDEYTNRKTNGPPSMSLERWARSNQFKDNWMTRHLTNQIEGELMPVHLEAAKEILRRLFIIGLIESKDESMRRFLLHFRVQLKNEKAISCADRLLHWGWRNKIVHDTVVEGSHLYELLAATNIYDMELYHFSQRLFLHQGNLFA